MPSLLYLSASDFNARGGIDYDSDTFRCMLVTSAYTPNGTAHEYRSDVTNEVAAGDGYTTGGNICTVTVAKNTGSNRVVITFGEVLWPSSTITARGAVYYKARGGAASADEIVAFNDFVTDKLSTGGTFTCLASTLTRQL